MPDKDLFNQLQRFNYGNVDVELINNQQEPTYITQDNYERTVCLNEINKSLFRDGGQIPATMKNVTATINSDSDVTVLTPKKGEIWELKAASYIRTSGTTETAQFYYMIYDKTADTFCKFMYSSNTGSDVILTSDDNWLMGYTFDSNVKFNINSTAATDNNYEFVFSFARIR